MVRQLFVPNGLLAIAALIVLAVAPPIDLSYQQPTRWLCAGVLAAAMLLGVRLHSLRAFLGAASVAAYLIIFLNVNGGPYIARCATALAFCDIALLLLVEDAFFDWQAAGWWAGLLAVQWTSFIALTRWDAAMVAGFAGRQVITPIGNIGPLELIFALCLLALFAKYVYSPDAVGAGMMWAVVVLVPGLRNARATETYILIAGTIFAIAAVERSHWIAYHDELTGLPGRRAFNEALAALGARYCIAMVDVDHFKRFNDSFGHETGDQVLRKVAALLARVGGGGEAYRCGGEEFAIIFHDSDMHDGSHYSEEVRASIEEDGFVARGPSRSQRERPDRRAAIRQGKHIAPVETKVTVSIGLAEASAEQEPREVIEAADKALYRAKKLGRNRVEIALTRQVRRQEAVGKA